MENIRVAVLKFYRPTRAIADAAVRGRLDLDRAVQLLVRRGYGESRARQIVMLAKYSPAA